MNHSAVQQKLTQHCKSTTVQSKKILIKKKRKYTNINPNTPEGQVPVNTHFIIQSAPDRRKLQKAAMGHQTPMNQLMDLAFGVFNNRDRVEEARRIQDNNERHNSWWQP